MNRLANRYSYILADLVFFEVRRGVLVDKSAWSFDVTSVYKFLPLKIGFDRVLSIGEL